MEVKKILGVFGGAFDPPHLGHALLPAWLRARGLVDRVLVAPAAEHPLGKGMSSFVKRLAWTRVAMRGVADFVEVTDLEERLRERSGKPSYALVLLEAVQAEHPADEVRLVVGSDIVVSGETARWWRWPDIERRFAPIVVPRAGHAPEDACALPDVSSTQVRAWLAAGTAEAEARLSGAVAPDVLALVRARPGPPVWVVGRGHVGAHAEPWLREHGLAVETVGAREVVRGAALPEAPPRGVWLTVRDANVAAAASALVGRLPAGVPVLHAGGALLGREALGELAAAGHPVGTLHPVASLRRELTFPSPLWRASFGVEGDDAARALAIELACGRPWLDLGGLDARGRLAYHAACSLAANHLAVLRAEATRVLAERGLPDADVEAAVDALLGSALANLLALGVPAGVSGPAVRGDHDMLARHAAALDEGAGALYETLSARLVEIVARAKRG